MHRILPLFGNNPGKSAPVGRDQRFDLGGSNRFYHLLHFDQMTEGYVALQFNNLGVK